MEVLASHRGGSGEPMVLLHGFTDTWRCWTHVLPALETHHDVLALTLPGHHGGEPFPEGTPMTIPASVDIIERSMDAAGFERAHLVGSSLGGWLSLELAARGRARSVVAICPAGGWEAGSREERAALRYFRRNDWLLHHIGGLMETIAARPRLRRLALRELVADPSRVEAADALAMFEGAAGCVVARDAIELAARGDMFGDLGSIEVPVRIAYGTRDRIVPWPASYVRMKQLVPDAEYVALEGLGHLPMWDDPGLVATTILGVTASVAPMGGG